MTKKSQASADTKRKLVSAFWELYSYKPIEKITIAEICQKAGYHRATFYVYFENIYEVLKYVEQELLDEMDNAIDIVPTEIVQNGFPHIAQRMITYVRKNQKYVMVLLGEQGDPAFAIAVKALIRQKLEKTLSDLPPEQFIKISYNIEFIQSAILGSLYFWFKNGQDISLEEFFDNIFDMLNDGMFTHLYQALSTLKADK